MKRQFSFDDADCEIIYEALRHCRKQGAYLLIQNDDSTELFVNDRMYIWEKIFKAEIFDADHKRITPIIKIIKCPKCDWTGTVEDWQFHHIGTGHA